MSVFLHPQQLETLRGDPAVNDEFGRKVRELDRRLQMNGLRYNQWDTLTDHQQDIFSQDLFLDGDCATTVEEYVDGATSVCDCPDAQEDLHSHSPVLMRAITQHQQQNPDLHATIGANESLDNYVDHVLTPFLESEDS
jgi:hypothetical protein